jgi:ATP-dependent Lon protease
VRMLTNDYTREAGVRNLERQIAAVCRKVALKAAEGSLSKVSLSAKALQRYLGSAPFENEPHEGLSELGVVNGLAWTEAGGDVLQVEATHTPGSGLVLTGQLGDVMKESGQTAFSWLRSVLRDMDVDESVLMGREVHVHVPNGATPKDGPSAGVTIATAIASLVTQIPVRGDIAMTGEITLRGKVLPVGGVREKALAALRLGITEVIVPRQCMKDIEDIPKELRKKLTFWPVSDMAEVLELALTDSLTWCRHGGRAARSPQAPSAPAACREEG